MSGILPNWPARVQIVGLFHAAGGGVKHGLSRQAASLCFSRRASMVRTALTGRALNANAA